MEDLTKEQIQKHISAAYDSVNLINSLNELEILTPEEEATVARNIEHLKIMLGKEWFFAELTAAQKSEINTIVA